MEKIIVNGKAYRYIVDYKNDNVLRNSFNSLTKRIYEFDFEEWYQNGYWTKRYIPYSLADGNTIISNVSVNVIDFITHGKKRTYVQIGTVMTDVKHRNQGLSRILMQKVLEEWKGKCDLIYLFANDSVLNFYPKFSFKAIKEYEYSRKIKIEGTKTDFTKLDMSRKENRDFLFKTVTQSCHFSPLSMYDNASLVMFYCSLFMSQDVYYIKEFDAIAIAEFNDRVLYLKDIFCENEVSIDKIILSLANNETNKAILGFTPNDTTSFDENIYLSEGDTLFILDDKWGEFENNKLKFPILSHA